MITAEPIVLPAWESIQLAKLPETRLSLLTGVAAGVLTQATQATQLPRQPSYQLPSYPGRRRSAPRGKRRRSG